MMKIGTRISPDWLNRPNDLQTIISKLTLPLGCVRRIDKRAKKVPHFTYTCSCPCKPHLWLPGTNRIHPFSRSSPSIAS